MPCDVTVKVGESKIRRECGRFSAVLSVRFPPSQRRDQALVAFNTLECAQRPQTYALPCVAGLNMIEYFHDVTAPLALHNMHSNVSWLSAFTTKIHCFKAQ